LVNNQADTLILRKRIIGKRKTICRGLRTFEKISRFLWPRRAKRSTGFVQISSFALGKTSFSRVDFYHETEKPLSLV